ncbi:hypothetical protein SASPL_111869 [Salvia splendens]|uniref:C2H2-type domain-containing protein n=1 Tax=Salvia splendens TaxID=180675 RepID=A0A8X8YDC5_SALSN|nr:hypothetical protein SASPL_111869 [Salvia splendens]
MDINPSRIESTQHLVSLGDDFAQKYKTKSFGCSFCKRGFPNAQALGGHMNIHRKDRAKLLEFSDENFLSLEISPSEDSNDSVPPDSFIGEKLSSENDQRQDEDDQAEENLNIYIRRIPLLAEAPPVVDLELRLGPEPHRHAKSKP